MMFTCVRSPFCLAGAWVLVQAWRASERTDADVKVVSSMRHGCMNWWLTPTHPNTLMKCNQM